MKLEKAVERAFDKCNLIGEDVDIIKIMYGYKEIRELPEKEFDAVYNDIAQRLGFIE